MGHCKKISSFPKILFFATVIISGSNALFLQSKLDGLVLTVTDVKVPPTGPNQRYGVRVARAHSHDERQQWTFNNKFSATNKQEEGYIIGYGYNAITKGLLGDDQYSFDNIYNIGAWKEFTIRGEHLKYHLLMLLPPRHMSTNERTRCLKNAGEGNFLKW